MADREKVISRMEAICNMCKENTWLTKFSSDTIYPLLQDAIALLKEQEEEIHMMDRSLHMMQSANILETELCDRCGRRRLKSNREGR